ncbi:MAG: hypothetical protein Q8Q59_10325 [Luteolibacter sp.]|jgi:hypothetical protein|nr:hypothetical protein [Luteolibacter sp.]
MKTQLIALFALFSCSYGTAFGQAGDIYTNFVRQVQFPTKVVHDVTTLPVGEMLSPLAIDPGGARFELWTVKSDPLTVYLLDSRYVGTYVPMADIIIRTEDPYIYTGIPRTRADRPFIVDITTSGLRSEEDAPAASKAVKLLRHVQSYGVGGTGEGINRSQAILLSQVSLVNNAVHRLSYALNSVPGADRSKVSGEERFSVFSLEDYQAPASQLASMYMQVWPVADGSIAGISQNQTIRFTLPQITLTFNDLYPDSRIYAQVYKGEARLGVEGAVVPGSGRAFYESVPQNIALVIDNWDAVIDEDGPWTLEILTATPFDLDRLDHVTFNVDRTIDVNASVTTIE